MRRLPLCLALLATTTVSARATCSTALECAAHIKAAFAEKNRLTAANASEAAIDRAVDAIEQAMRDADHPTAPNAGPPPCAPSDCIEALRQSQLRMAELNRKPHNGPDAPTAQQIQAALNAFNEAKANARASLATVGDSMQKQSLTSALAGQTLGGAAAEDELTDRLLDGGVSRPSIPDTSPPSGRMPVSPQVLAGQTSLANGRPDQANDAADQAIKQSPNDPRAFDLKAQALEKLGRHEEAVAAARQAAALDPDDPVARLLAGHGDALSRAESATRKASGLSLGESSEPGSGPRAAQTTAARPGYAAATMIAVGRQLPGAQASAPGAAMTAAKSPSQLLVEKAWQKFKLGDKTGALLAAAAAIDADPKNTWAWTIRAEVENSMGKFPPAEADAGRAIGIDAGNARAYRARAYAELEGGRLNEAFADAQMAIELEPGDGLGYLYRAMALDKLGRTAEALADYQKAVALDPTLHALADDAIARLSGKAAPAGVVAASSPLKKPLVRGGLIAGSLALILFGLLGTEAGRRLTTRPARGVPAEETAPALTRADLAPGLVLAGNYRLEREIGRGGMGVVFEAIDQALQRRVAIKQLQRDGDSERFLREARLVAQLKHPNLAEIYNVIDEGELYLVFEYVDGQGLDRALASSRKLSPAAAAGIVADVCAGVAYAHAQGIIHRDLKPSNVMLARDGKAKVMDFGIAHQSRSGAALTLTSASGTPPYMAPEQALGSTSKASDLYALAVMAYEMATGARPFEGPDFLEQKLQRQFAAPTRRDASLPAALDSFFAVALDPDPTKRHGDAASFARAFSAAIG